MLDTVVMSGDDVCCRVVFSTLVGVVVFSVMWSELLMTSAISCPLWSSVYECHKVECAFTSPVRTKCGMFVMYCMQCCMSVSAVCLCCVSSPAETEFHQKYGNTVELTCPTDCTDGSSKYERKAMYHKPGRMPT